MWDGFDQRKFPRLNLHCEIQIHAPDSGAALTSITENVGTGGVAVILNKPLERFSHCKIKLDLSGDKESIECAGKVVWIVPVGDARGKKTRYDVGIEFEDLKVESQALLKKHIESAAQKGLGQDTV